MARHRLRRSSYRVIATIAMCRACARMREARAGRAAVWAVLLLVLAATPVIAQKRCVKGIPCGNTCIAANKTCRVGPGSATMAPRTLSPVTIPDSMHFVASTRGRTYYWVGCSGWKSLAPANLRFFRTAADARAAGLRVSTQARCAGRAAVQGPADTTAAPAGTMLSIESDIQRQVRFGGSLGATSALERWRPIIGPGVAKAERCA